MTPTEQDKMSDEELTKAIYEAMQVPYLSERHDAIKKLITADSERVALEARIDTATDILYGFSRTYKQEVTDSAGNVYVNELHDYISKYEVQELVAELKAKQEETMKLAERNKACEHDIQHGECIYCGLIIEEEE